MNERNAQLKKIVTIAGIVTVIALSLLGAPNAMAAPLTETGTCNGATVTGTQSAVNTAMKALGCTFVAPATPSGIGADNSCKVTQNANLRSSAALADNVIGGAKSGENLVVIGHSADGQWTQTKSGWVWAAFCKLVPDTIETAPRQCNAYVRADGFRMDWTLDSKGVKYDVTIISTLPKRADGTLDLCNPYRVIQDGSHSSIINDQLPQPPGTRTDAPEFVDFTFLADDWSGVPLVYYSGVAGRLLIDKDKDGPGKLEPVLDVTGKAVEFTENGTQQFVPEIGGWYAYQCVKNCAFHWGFRLDRQPWARTN